MIMPDYTTNCPDGVCEKNIDITNENTDASGRMGIGDFAREMEKLTEEHLSSFGMNREALGAENKIWVIIWNQIHVNRLPDIGESTVLRMWPCKKKAGMYPRKYGLYTEGGEALACASSFFALMDGGTRKMAAPSEKMKQIPVVVLEGEQPLPNITMQFPRTLGNRTERIVQPEEIDKNGHLNNTHYLDWAEQLVKEAYGSARVIDEVWIQYSKELLEGECATLQYEAEEHTLYLRGFSGKEDSFCVVLKLR